MQYTKLSPFFYRLTRSILADKPRVTKFPIEWDSTQPAPEGGAQEGGAEMDDQQQQQGGYGGDDDQMNID